MPTDWQSLLQMLAAPGGVFLGLAYALHKRWVRLGREFDDMKADRDFWKALAMRSLNLADRAQVATEKMTTVAEQLAGKGNGQQ